ncbi:cytochrome c biogenesis CcdA family protein [Nonomuraea sp. NPDC050536]|uniref:cytochrome c biogenesis CcdA family protein n=1 Tax=Nonomuraea sp. NPDC050536 TaxID=3364366 RepID=UPI0037C8B386
MTHLGYATAFLGGLFSLLSPCGALLLPAFFAYAFPTGRALLSRTLLFYLGLCAVVVPLGMGSALATRLFYTHQDLLITLAGWTLIALGTIQTAGLSLPSVGGPIERLRGLAGGDSAAAVFTLGFVSGLGGFCAGPVLGGVLTIAAASGHALRGAALLAVYAAGMAAPLLLLAVLWQRFDLSRREWLRGRGLRMGPLRVHTTSLASGLLFITLGTLFLLFDGTRAVSLPDSWETTLDSLATVDIPDLAIIATGATALVAITVWRLRR